MIILKWVLSVESQFFLKASLPVAVLTPGQLMAGYMFASPAVRKPRNSSALHICKPSWFPWKRYRDNRIEHLLLERCCLMWWCHNAEALAFVIGKCEISGDVSSVTTSRSVLAYLLSPPWSSVTWLSYSQVGGERNHVHIKVVKEQ